MDRDAGNPDEEENENDAAKEEENVNRHNDLIKLACFNSRSLNNKSTALIDIFDETEISACLI